MEYYHFRPLSQQTYGNTIKKKGKKGTAISKTWRKFTGKSGKSPKKRLKSTEIHRKIGKTSSRRSSTRAADKKLNMSNTNKICVFSGIRLYLPIFEAYDSNIFHCKHWRHRLRRISYAFCSTVMIISSLSCVILMIWHKIESDIDLKRFVNLLPFVFTLLQFGLTFIVWIIEHTTIIETINRLQRVVDQREFVLLVPLPFS